MAEDAEVGSISNGDDFKNEIIGRSPLISTDLNRATYYLISDAKQDFTQLSQTFIKTPILQIFNPKCHI